MRDINTLYVCMYVCMYVSVKSWMKRLGLRKKLQPGTLPAVNCLTCLRAHTQWPVSAHRGLLEYWYHTIYGHDVIRRVVGMAATSPDLYLSLPLALTQPFLWSLWQRLTESTCAARIQMFSSRSPRAEHGSPAYHRTVTFQEAVVFCQDNTHKGETYSQGSATPHPDGHGLGIPKTFGTSNMCLCAHAVSEIATNFCTVIKLEEVMGWPCPCSGQILSDTTADAWSVCGS